MAKDGTRKMFVNLAVRDLKRSMEFYRKVGFEFNSQFTDENAACMVVNEDAYVMLLTESFFRNFTKRAICDTRSQTEGLFALSCGDRAEVDRLVQKAIDAGGSHAMPPMDHGSMYGRSFYDPDGHHWEVFWMEAKATAG
jgi:predicted lactoylglutathione lyase